MHVIMYRDKDMADQEQVYFSDICKLCASGLEASGSAVRI